MKTTCLLCDTSFSTDAYPTPQTAYLMCPNCQEKARAEAKAAPPVVKKKHNRKRSGNHQVSQFIRETLKARGIDTTAKDIRKAFPTAEDRQKQQVSALKRKARERRTDA